MQNLNKIIAGFTLLFFGAVCLTAQPIRAVSYETKLKVADEAAMKSDYYGAIEWYEKAYEESKDPSLQLAIADLYVLARDYNRAEKMYSRLLAKDKKNEIIDIRYDYGKVLKSLGRYKEAYSEFNKVIATESVNDSIKSLAKLEVNGMQSFDQLAPNLEVVVGFLKGKVNSASGESAPAVGPDGSLYFASFNRKKEIILDGSEGDYYAKIYAAQKDKDGNYDAGRALAENINRPDFNNAGVAFSRDGSKMYFTRMDLENNSIALSKLFVSTINNGVWGEPVEVPNVNGDYIVKHPIAGELFGNEVIFFSANIPGGQGGYDIYYSTVRGSEYGIPVNVGSAVNSFGDEITPFYKDGTLYFSSNSLPGLGGFDIFYATWNGSNWQDVTNIGQNYNSSYDDMYLRFDQKGTSGYLVSNRPAKDKIKLKGNDACCDDIYGFALKELVIGLETMVLDDKKPLDGAVVELYDLTLGGYPDVKNNVQSNKFNFTLEPDRNYKVIIKREGYFPDSIKFNTNGIIDDHTVKKSVSLKVDPNYNKNQIVTINEPIRLNNIYYDYDKWDILPDAEKDLEVLKELLDEYSDMVIELSSHTDARGKDAYNMTLSQKRAESAKAWLVKRGIASSRIKPVGYGETMIINHCTNKNIRECSDDEHRQNRRTEFKIIAGPQTIEIRKEVFKDQGGEKTRENEIKPAKKGGKQSIGQAPKITFKQNDIDLGLIKKGEKKELTFEFVNDGNAPLIIEIATTCKCTSLDYPTTPIPVGGTGVIKAVYDTTYEKIGPIHKTIDIIANTEPIVVEAKFKATIAE